MQPQPDSKHTESKPGDSTERVLSKISGPSVEVISDVLGPISMERIPSLTITAVEQDPDAIRRNLLIRGMESVADVDRILELIEQRRDLTRELDLLRSESNTLGRKGRAVTEEDIARGQTVRAAIGKLKPRVEEVEADLKKEFSFLPNFTAPDVPIGPESENKVIRREGELPSFDFQVRDHTELARKHDLVDFERGARVAQSGFIFLKNELYTMRQALSLIFMNKLQEDGFVPCTTPCVASEESLYATGYLPWATKDNFRIEGTDMSLIGTSEQALVSQHLGEMLSIDQLPLCYAADTQCFRTEAGSGGKDTRGMIRVHQFGKVEQIVICSPEESSAWQEKCLENEEWLLKELGIPYQVVLIASEDMGPPGYKKYDIEGWIPSQGRFRELTSNTNFGDFQSRRAGMRYKDASGNRVFPHTISATGFSDRLLVALLENNQQADGRIAVPELLKPFVRGKKFIGE